MQQRVHDWIQRGFTETSPPDLGILVMYQFSQQGSYFRCDQHAGGITVTPCQLLRLFFPLFYESRGQEKSSVFLKTGGLRRTVA